MAQNKKVFYFYTADGYLSSTEYKDNQTILEALQSNPNYNKYWKNFDSYGWDKAQPLTDEISQLIKLNNIPTIFNSGNKISIDLIF